MIQIGYYSMKSELDGSSALKLEVALLKKELEKEKARTQVAMFQHESFKQVVASQLPAKILEQNYSVRSLASVTQRSENMDLAYQDYERKLQAIRDMFLDKKYDQTAKLLESFIRDYPDSPKIHEAYFLYLSSLYEAKQYERAITYIDIMVENFPESELTGFSLLTMAEIFLKQERPEDAKSVLETVLRNFSFPEIKSRAQKKLREIEL